MSKLKAISSALVTALLMAGIGCKSKTGTPDVSGINVSVKLSRFDLDFFSLDTSRLPEGVQRLREKYPAFLQCFSGHMLAPPAPADSTERLLRSIRKALGYHGLSAAYDSTQLLYADLDWFEEELTLALKHFRYYYPDSALPQVVTFVSEYQYGVVTCTDSTFGIGLDMFLGRDFSFYAAPEIGIPYYRAVKMERDYILPSLFRAIAQNMIGVIAPENTLLAQMIHNGKIAAFIDAMMPDKPDHLKIDFTEEQETWCDDNEEQIWIYFNSEDLLFKQSRLEYAKYIADAPNTPGMPAEAPGNVGSWVGWQIVKAYMKRTGASIREVMAESNYQKIFEKSRYKPG